ncbi:MAG: redoxin domain-containing protein [Proteobacteria bacterium]|nr:redoxin domain-containing protein [Pseudomonadota bacterium]
MIIGRAIRLTLGLALLVWGTVAYPNLAAAELAVGDAAPTFELPGTDGNTHQLTAADESWAVIAWFPKAYTSGCTIECKSLAENGHLLRQFKVRYYMASVDALADNQGFAAQQQADFPLLSDVSKDVAKAFGVLSSGGYAKRHTFYMNGAGTIVAIDRAVKPSTSAEDMAAMLAKLGAPKI